jgi:hypothetical protein
VTVDESGPPVAMTPLASESLDADSEVAAPENNTHNPEINHVSKELAPV